MENQTPLVESGNDLDNFFNLSFDTIGIDTLRQASLWAKIISICSFVGYIFSLVSAFFAEPKIPTAYENSAAFSVVRTTTVISTIFVVIIGAVINYFLYRFAVGVDRGVKSMDTIKVNEGFNSLRTYFKILGILLIIALAIIVLWLLYVITQLAGA